MQGMEMSDYVNMGPGDKKQFSGVTQKSERKLCQLLLISFGVLCALQATLNISLRLAFYSSMKSTRSECNITKDGGRNTNLVKQGQCNELQERFNALTADKNLLENSNNILDNKIKRMEEDIERLKMKLRDLGVKFPQKCPAGWRKINSSCYLLSTTEKSWNESRTDCLKKKADLVVINSEEEQRAIYRLDGDSGLLFWIGLRVSTSFTWVDGSPLTQFFWQPNQPDNGSPNNNEDCVEMYHTAPVLSSWNDISCQKRRRWLCEKDPWPV